MGKVNKDTTNEECILPADEAAAFRDFLGAFITAVKNAAVYSSGHPCVVKWAKSLVEATEKLSLLRKEIIIGVTPEGLLIDGRYINKGYRPYKDIAIYLHHRYIERLKFNPPLNLDNIIKFISVLSATPEEIAKSAGSAGAFLEAGGAAGIDIKHLDYSLLLNSQSDGKSAVLSKEEDIWRFLLGDYAVDSTKGNPPIEKIAAVINDPVKIRNLLLTINAKSNPGIISKALMDVGKYLEINRPQESAAFVKNLVKGMLEADMDSVGNLSKSGILDSLKDFVSRHMKEGDILDILTTHIKKKQQIDDLLLNFMDKLASGVDGLVNLPGSLAGEIEKKGLMGGLPPLRDSVEKLLVSRPEDKFISRIYRENLSHFLKKNAAPKLSDLPDYKDDLNEDAINNRYFSILMFMLHNEEDALVYSKIAAELIDSLPALLKGGNISILRKLAEALEKDIVSPSRSGQLKDAARQNLARVINSDSMDEILGNIFSCGESQFKDAVSLLVMSNQGDLSKFGDLFLKEQDSNKRNRINYLMSQLKNRAVGFFDSLLAKRADISFEHYMSIIEILGSIDTEASQKLLISFFYKGNKMIAQEVLRELRNFSQPDIDFLFMALEYDDYFIRKEAIGVLTALGRREVNERILKILFVPNDIFGTKDQALMRSIELVDELRMSEAALNLISILTQRRFMFGKRLDALRLRAALALVNIGTPEVIKAVADFSSDRFKALREYAQMIKRTNF